MLLIILLHGESIVLMSVLYYDCIAVTDRTVQQCWAVLYEGRRGGRRMIKNTVI